MTRINYSDHGLVIAPKLNTFPGKMGVPYMAQATTMGKSSCHLILMPITLLSCMWGNQRPWNHFVLKYPPSPIVPDASVYSSICEEVVTVVLRKRERPFQSAKKAFHIFKSFKNSLFSQMWWKRLGTPLVRLIILWRKVVPGTMALHANRRVPTRDCSSNRRTERCWVKELRISRAQLNLSSGRQASIRYCPIRYP